LHEQENGMPWKTIAIAILILVAAILFRTGAPPYAIFLSANNGLSDTPLGYLIVVEEGPGDPGDCVVACKSLRCSLLRLDSIDATGDSPRAFVKSADAGAPYPIPLGDVKYHVVYQVPPRVWAPVLAVIVTGAFYLKRLYARLVEAETVWFSITIWLLLLLAAAAYALPATPRNPVWLPQANYNGVEVLEDYTIKVGLTLTRASPEDPEECTVKLPSAGKAYRANAKLVDDGVLVSLAPEDWYDIASHGRTAGLSISCEIPLAGVNGTLSIQVPVYVAFKDISISKNSTVLQLYNPNPFPVNVTYTLNYYTGPPGNLRLDMVERGNLTIEPLGKALFERGDYTRVTGSLRVEYPWGATYVSVSIP